MQVRQPRSRRDARAWWVALAAALPLAFTKRELDGRADRDQPGGPGGRSRRHRDARRLAVLSVLLAVLALLDGCATVESSGQGPPHQVSPSRVPGGPASPGLPGPTLNTLDAVCPSETPIAPGPDAQPAAVAAVAVAVPSLYQNIRTANWSVARAYPADAAQGFGSVVYKLCGDQVGQHTWVVELSFPEELPSASTSQGQVFVSRFHEGWRVWFRYH